MHKTVAQKAEHLRGTHQYMAPEMFPGCGQLEASRSTDIYALGTLCWEVLCKKRPWDGADLTTRAVHCAKVFDEKQNAFTKPPSMLNLGDLPPDTPRVVFALLERSLDAKRENRPPISEMSRVLNEEAEKMLDLSDGKRPYDVFLSHKWDGSGHHPLTTYVRFDAAF